MRGRAGREPLSRHTGTFTHLSPRTSKQNTRAEPSGAVTQPGVRDSIPQGKEFGPSALPTHQQTVHVHFGFGVLQSHVDFLKPRLKTFSRRHVSGDKKFPLLQSKARLKKEKKEKRRKATRNRRAQKINHSLYQAEEAPPARSLQSQKSLEQVPVNGADNPRGARSRRGTRLLLPPLLQARTQLPGMLTAPQQQVSSPSLLCSGPTVSAFPFSQTGKPSRDPA